MKNLSATYLLRQLRAMSDALDGRDADLLARILELQAQIANAS